MKPESAAKMFRPWRKFASVATGEWVLTRFQIPNGGAVVLFRSLFTSLLIFLSALAIINILDPTRTWTFSLPEFRNQVVERFHWLAAAFAANYTAFYARFASQWTYLADLYNRIKEAEATSADSVVVAEWKAGFLEDDENLHLIGKTTFVSTARVWASDPDVRKCFVDFTPGGEVRYRHLVEKVARSYELVETKFLT